MRLSLPAASDNALEVDHLLWALLALSLAVLGLVAFLLLRYIIVYRAGSPHPRAAPGTRSWMFESAWTAATLGVFIALFVWGARLYLRMAHPARGALEIHVVAKQWMWKVEHDGGQHEINRLHVPVGRPIALIMTSEDVIHDLSIPALRIKHDVLPGRYDALYFTARRAGTYRLYCTQFCGVNHSTMTGEVVALTPKAFADWLGESTVGGSLALQGRGLFVHFGCSGCHTQARGADESPIRAPPLEGLYGGRVRLADGREVIADKRYLRDSIMLPAKEVAAGYPPTMPSFSGVISEEELVKLIAYLESLSGKSLP